MQNSRSEFLRSVCGRVQTLIYQIYYWVLNGKGHNLLSHSSRTFEMEKWPKVMKIMLVPDHWQINDS